MIIHRALYREISITAAAIVVVLVVVFVLFGVTSALGRTVRGDLAETIVLQLIGWQTLRRLDLLIPLGFYLAVLLTFSRWYRDSEMTVLAACGVGLSQLLRPVLIVAGVVACLVAGISFVLTPLATRAIDAVKAEGSQRPEITGVTAGSFTEAAAGGRILYAESVSPNGRLERIFLNNPSQGRPRVILAREAYPFTNKQNGDRFVMLLNGWGYEGTPGLPDYQIVHFDTYAVRLEQKPIIPPPATTEGTRTRDLIAARTVEASAEWHWRLSKPMLVFVLALYAMGLAYTDARRGRLANLFVAILIYFIYSNMLGVGQTLIRRGQVPSELGLWWVHAVMIAIAALLLYQRNRNRPLVPRLQFVKAR